MLALALFCLVLWLWIWFQVPNQSGGASPAHLLVMAPIDLGIKDISDIGPHTRHRHQITINVDHQSHELTKRLTDFLGLDVVFSHTIEPGPNHLVSRLVSSHPDSELDALTRTRKLQVISASPPAAKQRAFFDRYSELQPYLLDLEQLIPQLYPYLVFSHQNQRHKATIALGGQPRPPPPPVPSLNTQSREYHVAQYLRQHLPSS